MPNVRRAFARSIPVLCCLCCLPASAYDWPGWRGPDRTGHAPTGEPVPASLPSQPKVIWQAPAGNGLASPIVTGDTVVYLDNQHEKEVVHAVDRATGKERWSVEIDDTHKDSQSTPGPRCTPLADADRVYAQSGRGKLKVLNLADGKVAWQTDYVKDFGATFIGEKGKAEGATRHGYTASPLLDGDHLIAEAGGGPNGAAIVCFNKSTGDVIWKSQADTPGYAAPVIATIQGTRQLIAFMSDAVLGLDPAGGKLLWRVTVKTSLGRHAATPVVVGDLVLISSHEVGLWAVRITKSADGFKAEQAWAQKDLAINFASPVAASHYLYGVGPHDNLICVDVETGKAAWSQDKFFTSAAGKAYAGILVLGPNLLVLTDDGQLVLIAADPAAYKELARARVAGKNWCIPAYADGQLVLRDDKSVLCVDLMH